MVVLPRHMRLARGVPAGRTARWILAGGMVILAACAERTFDNPVDTTVTLDPVSSVALSMLADTAIAVSWEYAGPTEAGFEIERQSGSGTYVAAGSAPAGARNYVDHFSLEANQSYRYRVRAAVSDNRSAYVESTTQQFTFMAPTGVQLTTLADTAVLVRWTYSGASQTGFEIERRLGGGSFTLVGTAGPADRQFLDRGPVVIGVAQAYRLRAAANVARSAYTAEEKVSLSFPSPTAVSLTSAGDTAVVSWTHPASFQTGFEVHRQIGGGGFSIVALVGPVVSQYRDSAFLADGNSYLYRVRAVSKNNQSAFTESNGLAASLAAPTGLRVIALTPTGVRLEWKDNSTIETGFEIEHSLDGKSFSPLATMPGNATQAAIGRPYRPLTDSSFHFRIRATNIRSPGAYSESVSKPGFVVAMVFVEGRMFLMGSTSGNPDEQPVHEVTLRSFYIEPHEVTLGDYRKYCNATGKSIPPVPLWGWDNADPLVNVSWADAVAYAQWAGKRLPTEAEWEYAARGGLLTQNYTFSGGNSLDAVGWFYSNSGGRPHVPGTKPGNELGVADMSGNVYEWCADWYGSTYYSTSPATDPKGPTGGTTRIIRGGAWDTGGAYCRVSYRGQNFPTSGYSNAGFRCALDQ